MVSEITFYQSREQAVKVEKRALNVILLSGMISAAVTFPLALWIFRTEHLSLSKMIREMAGAALETVTLAIAIGVTLIMLMTMLGMYAYVKRAYRNRAGSKVVISAEAITQSSKTFNKTLSFDEMTSVIYVHEKRTNQLKSVGVNTGRLSHQIICFGYDDMDLLLATLRERVADDSKFIDMGSARGQANYFSMFGVFITIGLLAAIFWVLGAGDAVMTLATSSGFGIWMVFGLWTKTLKHTTRIKPWMKVAERILGVFFITVVTLSLLMSSFHPCNAVAAHFTGCVRFVEDATNLTTFGEKGQVAYFNNDFRDEHLVILDHLLHVGERFALPEETFLLELSASENGSRLAFVDFDKLYVYDTRVKEVIWTSLHNPPIVKPALSPDGRFVAYSGVNESRRSIRINHLVDVDTNEVVRDFADTANFAYVSDAELFVQTSQMGDVIMNTNSGEIIEILPWVTDYPLGSLTVSADGQTIAVEGHHSVSVGKRGNANFAATFEPLGVGMHMTAALSPSGQYVAAFSRLGTRLPLEYSVVEVWRIEDQRKVVHWAVDTDEFLLADSVVFSAEATPEHLAIATEDGMFVYNFTWLMENHAP